jgi:TonB-dependent SusC/RagA subfamily outer membrane receptor
MTFNTKVVAQEKKLVKVEEVKIELIIDKNSTDATLEQEKITFKNEANIDLLFKGIKRNSDNEITAIKIEAKGENVKAKFENSGTEAIKPIKISYDSKNNGINIGNVDKIHKTHYSYTIHKDHDIEFKGKPNKDGNYVFVTSDGKTKSWTSKNSDTIIHENKIIIKSDGDKEHVWVHKNDDKDHNIKVEVIEIKEGKNIIKVIEEVKVIEGVEEIKKEYNIEIIEKKDGDSENVLIIKKDGFKTIEHKSGNHVMFISEDGDSPLFIIDGKESSKEAMEKISPDDIESISVLKGESASEKYGEKGENGVILITTKKQ